MNAKLIAVLEDFFEEKVEEVNVVEARINGGWYQVVPADEVDHLDDDEELAFVKHEPWHWFNGEKYYIVHQI